MHLVTLTVATLILTACGAAEPAGEPDEPSPPIEGAPADDTEEPDEPTDPAPSDDAPDQDVDALTFAVCDAPRYSVGYPQGWNTNADDGLLGPCEIFHPGEIDVPERPRDRDLHHAVSMYVDEVDFDDVVVSDNPNEVIETRETTVDDHRARVVEYRSTGQALTPEGEYSRTWHIDLDGQMLVVTTSSVGETDYERDRRIIDRMVTRELTLHTESATREGSSPAE